MVDTGQCMDLLDDAGSYGYAGGSSLVTFIPGTSGSSSTQTNSITPSMNYNVIPLALCIQRTFIRPTPYPSELAIHNVHAFQTRHPSEAERGQFMGVGVIRVSD